LIRDTTVVCRPRDPRRGRRPSSRQNYATYASTKVNVRAAQNGKARAVGWSGGGDGELGCKKMMPARRAGRRYAWQEMSARAPNYGRVVEKGSGAAAARSARRGSASEGSARVWVPAGVHAERRTQAAATYLSAVRARIHGTVCSRDGVRACGDGGSASARGMLYALLLAAYRGSR